MKIALPVKKQKDKYVLSPAFGKAKFFLVLDTQNKDEKLLENTYLSGKGVSQMLAAEKVDAVITNHLGEGAFRNLKNYGIKVYYCEKKNIPVDDVLKLFNENKFTEINEDNFSMVPQHHGHKHH